MSNPAEDLSTQLGTVLREKLGDISRIEKLKRLSGGASQEMTAITWNALIQR